MAYPERHVVMETW